MLREIKYWLDDVKQHKVVAPRRQGKAGHGETVDYTAGEFQGILPRVIGRLHPRSMTLRLVAAELHTSSYRLLRFERVDGPPPLHRAGQFVSLELDLDGVQTTRPFSITSAPGAGEIEIVVHLVAGSATATMLGKLKPGAELVAHGPAGDFHHEPLIDGDDLLLLADGMGVLPLVGIVRDLAQRGGLRRVSLVHRAGDNDGRPFHSELVGLAAGASWFDYTSILDGLLDAARLDGVLGDDRERTVYVSGPRAWVAEARQALDEVGLPPQRIREYAPAPPGDITTEPGWPDGLDATTEVVFTLEDGREIPARVGEGIAVALERAGVIVVTGCRSGSCGGCRIRLVGGRVFTPQWVRLRDADRRFGFIHPCSTYALEDLRLQVHALK